MLVSQQLSYKRRVFLWGNNIFLLGLAILCVLPLVHVLALSFSSSTAAAAGAVRLWPVDFTWKSYEYVMNRAAFWRSMWVSVQRILLGGALNLILTVSIAYPLSKDHSRFRGRTVYVWIFFFSTLFSGGLIPLYMLISNLKLMDTIWALVLPGAVPVFNIILMLNFFRQIPRELEEAAFIDGAGHWKTLLRVYIPCSLASIATVTLFSVVGHWNSYFDGLIYSNFPENYPLQSYLQTVVVARDLTNLTGDDWKNLQNISERTMKAAQIFVGAVPILCFYPFLQRYFVKGIIVGSVKG